MNQNPIRCSKCIDDQRTMVRNVKTSYGKQRFICKNCKKSRAISYTKDVVNNQLKIMEENHYYPFGLKHQKYTSAGAIGLQAIDETKARPANMTSTPYNYKYNGQEWQDELGLNMYDMDMRQYDPAIARWVVLDPVIHHSMSPYNSFDNNPVFWADPSGADAAGSVFDSLGTEVASITNMSSGFELGAGGAGDNGGNNDGKTARALGKAADKAGKQGKSASKGQQAKSSNGGKMRTVTLTTGLEDNGELLATSTTSSERLLGANKSKIGGLDSLPGPVFVGFSMELALPSLLDIGEYFGFGLAGGFVLDKTGNIDFYLTEKTLINNKKPAAKASMGFEGGVIVPAGNNIINNNDLAGQGIETSVGLGPISGSYGQNIDRTYYQTTIGGPGTSLDVGVAAWNTQTGTIRLKNGNK